jgi:hypothetical protein
MLLSVDDPKRNDIEQSRCLSPDLRLLSGWIRTLEMQKEWAVGEVVLGADFRVCRFFCRWFVGFFCRRIGSVCHCTTLHYE